MPTRILIAEDNDDYVRILLALFQRSGFDVTRVSTGSDAYELLKKGPLPDLLITDVMMPGMSGFELLARLKEDNIKLPVIMITSKQREEDVLRGLEHGAVDYITKPFSPTVVLARVKNALARKITN
ncbi:MAG: response regulator [Bdellovibrionales bacterium]|nr:response regulator [Oligoflexia bacterium]